ncbi:transposase domain-containing protein [Thalassospira alkalitolerans]|uniref:transposase domain-containing protein n=1 Tax=Thalassospira alkalitolerans TaxID=1293890 RepID=UPI0030EB67A1|tara:strand:+ start:3303 stop:5255 length:1953 start_codon:yes stop_codon:yes gene_type:complete
MKQEWFSPTEIAELKLPQMPVTVRGINVLASKNGWRDAMTVSGDPLARKRKASGGGWEYSWKLFTISAQTELQKREIARNKATVSKSTERGTTAARVDWEWFEALPETRKQKAHERFSVLDAICSLQRGALSKDQAVAIVSSQQNVGASTIYNWFKLVEGLDRKDWLPALCPRHAGRTKTVDCDPSAWEFIKADWLRLAKPPFAACYERLEIAAEQHGWTIPAARTLERRLNTEIPVPVKVLLREGSEKLKMMYPPQDRDRTEFHAMEAVNVDGHKWDVFVRFPDGEVTRPLMIAIQDLYSNKCVAWRVDKSENSDLVRLAFGDLFREYGIPDHAWLDNGRGFAAKCITGGTPNRFRFKVKPEEPSGILTALGVDIHWTTPYSGQSKPIERMFRDFCNHIAKHPAFQGAYTGNSPMAKPEDYASRAIDLDEFLKIVGEGIRMHNARGKRKTRVCGGIRSFDQVFDASYQDAVVRKAAPEQLRMCLLAAEQVRTDKRSGRIELMGNKYWSDCLHDHIGKPIMIRFDPDFLHESVFAYRLDGSFIGEVELWEASGFADRNAAREHGRKRRTFINLTKKAAEIERTLSIDEYMRLLPDMDETAPSPQPAAVRLVTGNLARQAEAEPVSEQDVEGDFAKNFRAGLQILQGGRDE